VPIGEAVIEKLPEAQGLDIPVRFEDEWLMVIAKPAGLVVHPAPGHPEHTLVNALLARAERPAGGAVERPGIVHRLDAGTSGLMIVAKDEEAFERLTAMMANREVSRTYHALAEGLPSTNSGTIDAPIGRSARNRKKMGVVAEGRESITDFRVIEDLGDVSLLEVKPRTGRTHQIRVHLAAIGHPVVGDAVYGHDRKVAKRLGLERPFLHAAELRFTHPMTGEEIAIAEPLPSDLEDALAVLHRR
jgi:23S rRNA pseudouridine1911/1915/1917 synthase